jgi:hypothetical protein
MANFFTDIAPNVIFSKDATAVIDYYVQHKLLGDVCNCPTCPSSKDQRYYSLNTNYLKHQRTLINPIKMGQLGCN